MSLFKKVKDILFEEEEYTEPIQIKEEVKEEPKIVKIESEEDSIPVAPIIPEEEVKPERTFQFPDFDEEEFASNISKPNTSQIEIERKKVQEKKPEYPRNERIERFEAQLKEKETIDRKKFKPSPIISPVYGILNQDYRAEDIVNKGETPPNIDIDVVRKKAFEIKEEEKEEVKDEISEPVVTFFEEKKEEKIDLPKEEVKGELPKENYKSIDDLLEEASSEVELEDTIEIPNNNNLNEIEEELEKLDVEEKEPKVEDDSSDSDLFELIDSMYDDREEVE